MKVIVDIPEDVIEATKNGSANIYNLCGYLMNSEILEPCEDAKAYSKKEEGRPVVLPYRERKCRRCKYGDAYELQKPCIVYSESCELFAEKE